MYEISGSYELYEHWACYDEWLGSPYLGNFNEWVVKKYPELINVEWDSSSDDSMTRIFQFESEEMYQWFLLRQ